MRVARISLQPFLALSPAGLTFCASLAGEVAAGVLRGPSDVPMEDLEDPHPPIDQKALDRLTNKILDARRRDRLRRGLAAEESIDERNERFSRFRRRLDKQNPRGKREMRQKLPGDGELHDESRTPLFPAERQGRRRMQTTSQVVADGFLISYESQGFRPRTLEEGRLFWSPGIYDFDRGIDPNNNTDDEPPALGSPLGLRDLINDIGANNSTEGYTIFWNFTQEATRQLTASLEGIPNPAKNPDNTSIEYYMEIRKQKKGELVYIDQRDDKNPEQLWDFRPGPGVIFDNTDPLLRYFDRTWRPSYQLGKREFCVEPVIENATVGIQEFANMRIKKCASSGLKRRRQTWIYCVEGIACDTANVDPPDFEIEVRCDNDNDECRDTIEASLSGAPVFDDDDNRWDDLDRSCDGDASSSNTFGNSRVYEIRNNNDNELDIEFEYECDEDSDSAEAYLRVYIQDGSEWDCAFDSRTTCSNDDNEITTTISEHDEDFLIIVSGYEEDGNLEDFTLEYECEDRNNNDACDDDDVTLNVENDEKDLDDLDGDFDSLRTVCNVEENSIDDDQSLELKRTWHKVDTRGNRATLTVQSECDTDDAGEFNLETLIRIYRIVENDNNVVTDYECIDSEILRCFRRGDDPRITTTVDGDDEYLIVATGGVEVEDCTDIDFGCR